MPVVHGGSFSDAVSCIIYATKKYLWIDRKDKRGDFPVKHMLRTGRFFSAPQRSDKKGFPERKKPYSGKFFADSGL